MKTSRAGWTCSNCGAWVAVGVPHYCGRSPSYSPPQTGTWTDPRIADALERIAVALEQIAAEQAAQKGEAA